MIAAFPYICTVLAAAGVFALRTEHPAAVIVPVLGIGIAAFAVALLQAVRNAVCGLTAKRNLKIKCIQIPAYLLNFALAIVGVLMSVFGIPAVLWAVAIDFLSILLTGVSAIGCGRELLRAGKISSKQAVWMMIGSFIYCADIVVAIAYYQRSRK